MILDLSDEQTRALLMKRTLAAAILSTFLVLTSPAHACMTMTGFEPINSARLWKSWNSSERVLYLWGFEDGSSRVLSHFGPIDEKAKQILQAAALRYDLSQIRDVM